ncbi:uncharacterized protein B0T23DRAFT_138317 [Neurospora hispaniola]|uniref:Uncharacterized protein n=1 Tax=Neurospora hispaniola TaxID=588809 RepID=A0AAJ0I7B2_9PEZI|nr:hypothetical protein B0T23DRAFT_138317 [Neurospora hispaniola]
MCDRGIVGDFVDIYLQTYRHCLIAERTSSTPTDVKWDMMMMTQASSFPLDKSSFCTAFHIFPVIRSSVHSSILVSPESQMVRKISSYTFLQLSTTQDRWYIRQQPHQTYTKHHHIVNMALEVERESGIVRLRVNCMVMSDHPNDPCFMLWHNRTFSASVAIVQTPFCSPMPFFQAPPQKCVVLSLPKDKFACNKSGLAYHITTCSEKCRYSIA